MKAYGDGGWGEIWIYGIFKSKGQVESRLLDLTLHYRETYNLKKEFICIAIGSGSDGYIFFFDTSRMCDGECPVVVFNDKHTEINEEYIVQIANKWSPEDIENYPYKDAMVGLIEN